MPRVAKKLTWQEEFNNIHSTYALQEFAYKYLHSTSRNDKVNAHKSSRKRKEEEKDQYSKFYKLLRNNLLKEFRSLSDVLRLLSALEKKDEYPPPKSLLMLLPCQRYVKNKKDIQQILDQYPSILHIKSSVNGADDDLLIHRLARTYACAEGAEMFEYVWMKGIDENVGKSNFDDKAGVDKDILKDHIGGLTTANSFGQTPLSLVFGKVISDRTGSHQNSWKWFVSLMVKAAEIKLNATQNACKTNGKASNKEKVKTEEELKGNDEEDLSSCKIPPLNAALELGAPSSVINEIIAKNRDYVKRKDNKSPPLDFLGRTPLVVAASNPKTSMDVIITLLQTYPNTVHETDLNGDSVLTQLIRAGPKKTSVMYKDYLSQDIFYLGSCVQIFPEIMELPEVKTGMLPFMLAAIEREDKNWSLDVVYSLLRTAPYVLRTFSEVKD